MRVLVTGAQGQIGRAVLAMAPAAETAIGARHAELDIRSRESVERWFESVRPDVVVNAAAYTAVDKAESEPDLATQVNADGPSILASAARRGRARLIHLSTDFVFDGLQASPYQPNATPRPMSVYAVSKLAGERAVQECMRERAVVLRTAWVYASYGHNFLRTMLRLMNERGEVRVVADQVGTPTSARSVARAVWAVIERPEVSGIHHWTDLGIASWYDFAVAIAEEAAPRGLVPESVRVMPIASDEYPASAKRPPYSVLDKRMTIAALGITPAHWRSNLRTVLGEMTHA